MLSLEALQAPEYASQRSGINFGRRTNYSTMGSTPLQLSI